jgi:hypothetical protein
VGFVCTGRDALRVVPWRAPDPPREDAAPRCLGMPHSIGELKKAGRFSSKKLVAARDLAE